MPTIVQIRHLTLGYPGLTLFRNLSINIDSGTTLAVLGANGSGKSTFVKMLLGLIEPLSGQLNWPGGRPREIGYLAQMTEFDRRFPIRVRDLAAMGAWHGLGLWSGLNRARRDRVAAALDETGVLALAERSLHTLSGGQLQRALFARVILQDAPLILLDEPFAAVDQSTEAHLLSIIRRWHDEGRAVVLVVHDLSSVLDHCSHALLLGGEAATHGPVEYVLTPERLVNQGYLSASQASWMFRNTSPQTRVIMVEFFTEMWSFAFMRRAFVATTVLSASITPVGAFLVLRRLSLAGEAMAHAITPGIVIGFVAAGLSVLSLLVGGLIAGVGVAILTALLARKTILRSDASLASLYLIALAVGIFILSAAGSAVPLKSFLFGSILGIDDASMMLVGGVAMGTLVSFAVLLRPLIVSTCDPVFFEAQTRRPWLVEQGFMLLLVLNLLAAFKTLGTLMAVGLMILPATAARYWVNTITGQLVLGFMFALSSCWIGLTLSYLFPKTPSGPAIVLVAGGFFLMSTLFGPLGFGRRLRKLSNTADLSMATSTTKERTP